MLEKKLIPDQKQKIYTFLFLYDCITETFEINYIFKVNMGVFEMFDT